jgi:hypothetical protein
METLRPFWEIGLGTALVLTVLFVHGFAMFGVQSAFDKWWPRIVLHPHLVMRKVFMGAVVLSLLGIHYIEILLWASSMYGVGALPDLRSAFYFAGGAYTTYGSGDLYLPANWRLLGFMIATSGLFTFGWTTGILISILNRFFHAGGTDEAKRLHESAVVEAQARLRRTTTDVG